MTDGLDGIADQLLTRLSWSYRLSWTIWNTLWMRRMLTLGHRITSSGSAGCSGRSYSRWRSRWCWWCIFHKWKIMQQELEIKLVNWKWKACIEAWWCSIFVINYQFWNTGPWIPSQPFCCCINFEEDLVLLFIPSLSWVSVGSLNLYIG